MTIPINERQRHLMQWLASRKVRPFIVECDGPDLHHLINHNLAVIEPPPFGHAPMFGRVGLTRKAFDMLDDENDAEGEP